VYTRIFAMKHCKNILLLVISSFCSINLHGQDTLLGDVPNDVFYQHCGLDVVVVSKSPDDGFQASGDDQVVIKSGDRVIFKPGFKAGGLT